MDSPFVPFQVFSSCMWLVTWKLDASYPPFKILFSKIICVDHASSLIFDFTSHVWIDEWSELCRCSFCQLAEMTGAVILTWTSCPGSTPLTVLLAHLNHVGTGGEKGRGKRGERKKYTVHTHASPTHIQALPSEIPILLSEDFQPVVFFCEAPWVILIGSQC